MTVNHTKPAYLRASKPKTLNWTNASLMSSTLLQGILFSCECGNCASNATFTRSRKQISLKLDSTSTPVIKLQQFMERPFAKNSYGSIWCTIAWYDIHPEHTDVCHQISQWKPEQVVNHVDFGHVVPKPSCFFDASLHYRIHCHSRHLEKADPY